MKDIILNEAATAAKVIAGDARVEDIKTAISLIARYDIQAAGIDVETTKEHLRKTIPHLFRNINIYQYEKQITYWAEHGDVTPLRKLDGVPITQKELDVVLSLDGVRAKCWAFTLLALAKLETLRCADVNSWVRGDRLSEAVRRADLKFTDDEMCAVSHQMYKGGLLGLAERIDNVSLHVLYADYDGEPVMMLNDADFRHLGFCLRAYLGEKYTRCEECGGWIKQAKNGRRRFCDDCSADNHRSLNSARMRKTRA